MNFVPLNFGGSMSLKTQPKFFVYLIGLQNLFHHLLRSLIRLTVTLFVHKRALFTELAAELGFVILTQGRMP